MAFLHLIVMTIWISYGSTSEDNGGCHSPQYLKFGSRDIIQCSFRKGYYGILWYNTTEIETQDPVVELVDSLKSGKGYTSQEYDIYPNGSLIINNVSSIHDQNFTAVVFNSLNEEPLQFVVAVVTVAYPDPAHPLVEGCGSQQFCILDSSQEGSLTCSVTGIRPEVLLEWTVGDELSEMISFEHQNPRVNERGETFSITRTSLFRVLESSLDRVIVKCQITGPQMDVFKDATTVELLIHDQHKGGNLHSAIPIHWKTLIGIGIAFTCAAIAAFVIYKAIARLTSSRRQTFSPEEEDIPMLQSYSTSDQFISQLKEMYGNIYNSVHPIPANQDKFYSVNRLFVTGDIELLKSNSSATSDVWEKKVSYKDVFKDETTKSMRYIVQGEAGYGKSTLMLQLVHDWCKNDLHGEIILIFLQLRKLTSEMTVFEAIRRFSLPGDSDFSDSYIESILVGSDFSVVIILDGFDEYPDKDKDSDILKIIRRDMLRHCKVVLTTRPGYLHEKYFIQAQRIRLTGFNNQAQDEYIRKTIVGGNNAYANNFQRRLRAYGALSKLLSVPLIFAAFVHMSHERENFQKINCLTTIVENIISIFDSHMKNKIKDDKVSDYQLFAKNHEELNKMAFDVIFLKKKEWKWSKNDLCRWLGQDFCNYLIRTGIMDEKDKTDNVAHSLQSEQLQHNREVAFSDSILCEWYAAHYLVREVLKGCGNFQGSFTDHGKEKELYVQYFQQVYRIACGLNNGVANAVIEYLKTTTEADMFVLLCRFERDKNEKQLKAALKKTCGSTIHVRRKDSLVLQSSSVQVLYIAASCDIPIQCVKLIDSYKTVNLTAGYLLLESDIRLSSLSTLVMLWLDEGDMEMKEKQFKDLLKFSCSFSRLQSLKFSGFLLPPSVKDKDVCSLLKTKDLSVLWDPRYTSNYYHLNFESGKWEHAGKAIDYQSELSRWLKRFIT